MPLPVMITPVRVNTTVVFETETPFDPIKIMINATQGISCLTSRCPELVDDEIGPKFI